MGVVNSIEWLTVLWLWIPGNCATPLYAAQEFQEGHGSRAFPAKNSYCRCVLHAQARRMRRYARRMRRYAGPYILVDPREAAETLAFRTEEALEHDSDSVKAKKPRKALQASRLATMIGTASHCVINVNLGGPSMKDRGKSWSILCECSICHRL